MPFGWVDGKIPVGTTDGQLLGSVSQNSCKNNERELHVNRKDIYRKSDVLCLFSSDSLLLVCRCTYTVWNTFSVLHVLILTGILYERDGFSKRGCCWNRSWRTPRRSWRRFVKNRWTWDLLKIDCGSPAGLPLASLWISWSPSGWRGRCWPESVGNGSIWAPDLHTCLEEHTDTRRTPAEIQLEICKIQQQSLDGCVLNYKPDLMSPQMLLKTFWMHDSVTCHWADSRWWDCTWWSSWQATWFLNKPAGCRVPQTGWERTDVAESRRDTAASRWQTCTRPQSSSSPPTEDAVQWVKHLRPNSWDKTHKLKIKARMFLKW